MQYPILSILIPSVRERYQQCCDLIGVIAEQLPELKETGHRAIGSCTLTRYSTPIVEVIVAIDNKEISIGEKRQLLHEKALGTYITSIDDDDSIAPDFISEVLAATETNADCITFEERIDIDGKIQRSNHSIRYAAWQDNYDGFDYVRTPFFKSVIKRDIALQVPVASSRFGEDHDWAMRIFPLLKTEVHLPKQLYLYNHVSSNFNERYGIK